MRFAYGSSLRWTCPNCNHLISDIIGWIILCKRNWLEYRWKSNELRIDIQPRWFWHSKTQKRLVWVRSANVHICHPFASVFVGPFKHISMALIVSIIIFSPQTSIFHINSNVNAQQRKRRKKICIHTKCKCSGWKKALMYCMNLNQIDLNWIIVIIYE